MAKKSPPRSAPGQLEFDADRDSGEALAERVMEGLRETNGKVRVEDFITTLASIVGELCIEAAGDFTPRAHTFTPGSKIFSEKANILLTGGDTNAAWPDYPLDSVCGLLREILSGRQGYLLQHFPSMKEIFESFAAQEVSQTTWGRLPWAVPDEHKPRVLPIRMAYETRAMVDEVCHSQQGAPRRRLRSATMALAIGLLWVSEAIDHSIILRLAVETVHGMSKTVPMTAEALASIAARSETKH